MLMMHKILILSVIACFGVMETSCTRKKSAKQKPSTPDHETGDAGEGGGGGFDPSDLGGDNGGYDPDSTPDTDTTTPGDYASNNPLGQGAGDNPLGQDAQPFGGNPSNQIGGPPDTNQNGTDTIGTPPVGTNQNHTPVVKPPATTPFKPGQTDNPGEVSTPTPPVLPAKRCLAKDNISAKVSLVAGKESKVLDTIKIEWTNGAKITSPVAKTVTYASSFKKDNPKHYYLPNVVLKFKTATGNCSIVANSDSVFKAESIPAQKAGT